MASEQKVKEYLRLMIEYLRENPSFKHYCSWKRRHTRNREAIQPRNVNSLHLRVLYDLFGDIFFKTFIFEDWWDSNREIFTFQQPVRDFKRNVRLKIDRIITKLTTEKKRTPTAKEVKNYFIEHLDSTPERAVIEIDLSGDESPKSLGKQVRLILESMTKIPRVKVTKRNRNFLRMRPPSPFRSQELIHNLRVYALKERDKLRYRAISNKLYPREEYSERIRRKLKTQYENARNDIAGVVKGRFPSHQEKPSKANK